MKNGVPRLMLLLLVTTVGCTEDEFRAPTAPEGWIPPPVWVSSTWSLDKTVTSVTGALDSCAAEAWRQGAGETVAGVPLSVRENGSQIRLEAGDYVYFEAFEGVVDGLAFVAHGNGGSLRYACNGSTYELVLELEGTFSDDRQSLSAVERRLYFVDRSLFDSPEFTVHRAWSAQRID